MADATASTRRIVSWRRLPLWCLVAVLAPTLAAQQPSRGAGAFAQDPTATAAPGEPATVELVRNVTPAVVTVVNLQRVAGPFGITDGVQPAGTGTGFVIDEDGHVVTNNHVVAGGQRFEVVFAAGETRPAELVGADPTSDLAVVRIDGEVPATVPLGDSDALQVGQPVVAIGSPLGAFTTTVTAGIVSALDRDFPAGSPCSGLYTNLVQHDAAINPGNSGGPLFDLAGGVVGVNTLGIPTTSTGQPVQGLFFAIPANTVRDIVGQLIEDGAVAYPYAGIAGAAITPRLAAQQDLPVGAGWYVIEAPAGEPAAAAGIRAGDIIVALAGQPIDAQHPFSEVLYAHEPGETVTATVLRGDERLEVELTLGERPPLDEICYSQG